MAMNTPSTGSTEYAPVVTSRSRTPVDRLRRAAAEDLLDHAVPHHADLRVGEQPRLQDLLRPQRVAPMDQRDVVGMVGQVERLLHRGVAAADHRDALAAIEEPVAGGAGRDAAALQPLLRFAARASAPARRWRGSPRPPRRYRPKSPRQRNGRAEKSTSTITSGTIRVPTCSACAAICSISQGPWMASAKPGIVLDVGGDGELPARLQARRPASAAGWRARHRSRRYSRPGRRQ